MIRFTNDYGEAAHPQILEAIARTNLEGNPGYSTDDHSARARALICEKIARPDAAVHFLVGGTQTNFTLIAAALRPYEAVISADSGHICTHETGAVEATGHKCVACPAVDGKLTPAAVEAAVLAHTDEHMVLPRLVYVSQTTEIGTVYSRAELEALRAVCDKHGLYLYLDGARLGSALACSDVTLPDLGRLCDAFTLGGTKNGALFGEALVLTHPALNDHFRWQIKQRGGMLAKGWLLGLQFEVLMTGGLYEELGAHANAMAQRLKAGIAALGYGFTADSPSNQQFAVLPDAVIDALRGEFDFIPMAKQPGGCTEVRLVTSWATTPEAVDAFLEALAAAGC